MSLAGEKKQTKKNPCITPNSSKGDRSYFFWLNVGTHFQTLPHPHPQPKTALENNQEAKSKHSRKSVGSYNFKKDESR